MKRVFVSGCFDMLHSGHITFLEKASKLGEVYVGIGSDKTIKELKGRTAVNNEAERLYMIRSIKFVREACINSGTGLMDFEKEILDCKADILYVNKEGASPLKEKFCKEHGIEYIVDIRNTNTGFQSRSTTQIIKDCTIPYRIDLAGGWLDQLFVNKHCAGSVITCSIEPTIVFNEFSGMASSTRRRAINLWGNTIPTEIMREKAARQLFCFENEPTADRKYISGSQDALGICLPGINKLSYENDYWPFYIETILDEDIISWLENLLWLVPLYPRSKDCDIYKDKNINIIDIQNLSWASDRAWKAIKEMNTDEFASAYLDSFKAQIKLFPSMIDDRVWDYIEKYINQVKGYKLSGCGAGGYIIFISEEPLKDGFQIKITRE